MRRFRRDPLGFLDNLSHRHPGGVFPLPWGGWCVGDAELARKVLTGKTFNGGRSIFFGEMLPTRSAQIEVGHAVRDIVGARLPDYRDRLAAAVDEMPAVTQWPTAGTELVYRCTADTMLHPDSPPGLRRLLSQASRGNVLIRAPRIRQRARAQLLRNKLRAAVTEHVRDRRGEDTRHGEPRDVLDAIIDACPDEVDDRTVADLYMLLFVSIVGTVGYSLAWSVLLAGLHAPAGSPWPWPADQIVREASRHRPLVWMVGRPAPYAIELGGITFRTGDVVSVSPYLLHHDEHRWNHPGVFRPERWAESDGRGPYLPFSTGPFVCAGAAIAHTLITDAVTALTSAAPVTVIGGNLRPIVTNANTPRPFALHRA
ncbi:cytochrome P450 [Nocardia transvalensis]|nr:cytochrome P450 [Nocardia transvalensis]